MRVLTGTIECKCLVRYPSEDACLVVKLRECVSWERSGQEVMDVGVISSHPTGEIS